ncbi:Plasminogen activator inhibitor 1 [Tetrabaena socialis]|uniref:Plasminogen activator inhibitor 1 n=1 Tax=Tetrabaena socialis TaxID=47790 RepID=A0A2J8AIT2_9CHLO|nr:Plasminogen activator inhibitor 1 [Tetrabaena socialis]|eukprot:PNH12429.1 Plasminogen activator inhibitor 1 [Tetrabaena socialis]
MTTIVLIDDSASSNDVVAVVEVDEEGTVAAAATAIMMTRSLPMPPAELIFDRPFAFIIHHIPTGLPAFVGVVNDPSATA